MNNCINRMNRYVKKLDVCDMGLLKICMCAVGVMMGLKVSNERKKLVGIAAGFFFVLSYIPLMAKFIDLVINDKLAFMQIEDQDFFE